MSDPVVLSPAATGQALPYPALADEIASLLRDPDVVVPPRLIEPLAGGGSLFVMPAHDARVAITKLITFTPGNSTRGLPTIQGDIVVFDVATGQRRVILDGPTVTARRTAAVSLLAARLLAPRTDGPLLIVGAGVQGLAHLEAFHAGLGVREVLISSRTPASADALVRRASELGIHALRVDDPNEALADCPLVVTATPAQEVVMRGRPRSDAFIAAVGAFTPRMMEWAPEVCRYCEESGRLVVDTRDADHEAGDLLQAGIAVSGIPTLGQVVGADGEHEDRGERETGPVFFKNCGWAGWDLAAARCCLA